MNERISEVLYMLFECPDIWVPLSSDREGWLCHPSKEGFDLVFERMLGSVILQPILPVKLIPESVVTICERI